MDSKLETPAAPEPTHHPRMDAAAMGYPLNMMCALYYESTGTPIVVEWGCQQAESAELESVTDYGQDNE